MADEGIGGAKVEERMDIDRPVGSPHHTLTTPAPARPSTPPPPSEQPNLSVTTSTPTRSHPAFLDDDDSSTSSLSPVPSDAQIDTSIVKPPPNKKRKVGESPPWKSALAAKPTTIIENGRRRSGRINLADSQTRDESPSPKPRSARGTQTTGLRNGLSAGGKASPGKGRKGAGSATGRPLTNGASESSKRRRPSPVTETPSRRPRGKLDLTPASPSPPKRGRKPSAKQTPAKTPVTVGSRRSTRVKENQEAEAAAQAAAEAKSRKRKGRKSKADDFDFSSSSSDAGTVSRRRPVVKLVFKAPPKTITNPNHVLPKPKFSSLAEFLEQDELVNKPEELAAAEEAARQEAEILDRIEQAARNGVLAPHRYVHDKPGEKQSEPKFPPTHHDYLITHALHFRKLMDRERRNQVQLAKRLAYACANKVREAQPKTKEELEEEEEMENRKMYKETVGAMKKKWAMVAQEVEQRRIQRKIEEERLKGEENLKKVLEQSSKLLAKRVRRGSEAAEEDSLLESGDEEGEDDLDDMEIDGDDELEEDDEEDENESEDVENGDDEVMSSSGESEEEAAAPDDDDSKLTVEELRAKYAKLVETPLPEVTETEENPIDTDAADEDVEMRDPDDGSDDESDAGRPAFKTDLAALLDEDDGNSILDEDDESVIMDSELDEEEDEDGDDEDEEDASDDPGLGLAGFYGDLFGTKKLQEDDERTDPDAEEDEEEYAVNGADNEEEKQEPPTVDEAPREASSVTVPVEELVNGEPKVNGVANKDPAPTSEPEVQDEMEVDSKPTESPDQPKAETVDIEPSPAQNEEQKEESPAASEVVKSVSSDIKTPIPFLLRGTLREYQHHGLDWLAGLYENKTNGILADEMGLGKTIQTIALLAHLACEKEVWGPHLVVVPTSVILNWEMEFKKWAPGFKILTYYGSREQRAEKRKGWLDNNLWHVCITSYQLVIQDATIFKRRHWHYLILDEAHNIKNFRSQRWQTLLNFRTEARLLLTGTPLQNNLVELWSLLYFLMPSGVTSGMPTGFADLKEFQEWFARPVDQILENGRERLDDEAKHTVQKLHQVLRPYLLRRLKADVEKQMPAKYEHIVTCRLSKRQRYLYDEFMSLAQTRETLSSGNYLSIINCLMQLRKVCNHPDLFETRQIVTSFATNRSVAADFEIKDLLVRRRLLHEDEREKVNLDVINLLPVNKEKLGAYEAYEVSRLGDTKSLMADYDSKLKDVDFVLKPKLDTVRGNLQHVENKRKISRLDTLKQAIYLNKFRTEQAPIFGKDLVEVCTVNTSPLPAKPRSAKLWSSWHLSHSDILRSMIPTLEERGREYATTVEKFGCVTPAVVTTDLAELSLTPEIIQEVRDISLRTPYDPFHEPRVRLSIQFPDKRLLQYDCGKLQRLDTLLRQLQAGGHRALIFTQMTKVLDILEQFLNIHGHRYLRLDGATRVEQRQILTDRFNNDPRIPVFILSSRSGGLGINLTGADTVIFYDMDWNPAMDKQCQDRCHRIGQTRDVHIYRFVSEHTIESNILKKANQKRMLDDVVIQEGEFTTDYFTRLDIRDMLDGLPIDAPISRESSAGPAATPDLTKALEAAEDDEDVAAAKVAAREIQDADVADFVETKSRRDSLMPGGANKNSSSTAATPAEDTPCTPGAAETPVAETPAAAEADGEDEAEDDEEGAHIDEYMLRFMEWELRDVPVVIPTEKGRNRKKNNKKAKIRY